MCKAIEDMLKETAARVAKETSARVAKEAAEEIAVRMLSDGISVEDAAKYSQLPIEEVKKLQANQMKQ